VDIRSDDALHPDRPRTRLRILANRTVEWLAERFDRFDDVNPTKRFRIRLKRYREFRARLLDADGDFNLRGYDEAKDTTVRTYDIENDSEVDPVTDLGSRLLYENVGNAALVPNATNFRRVHRTTVRFGPNRISRVVFSFLSTNIKNGFDEPEITVPGGVNWNLLVENAPFIANDSSFALEFDVDLDADEGTLTETDTGAERDITDGLTLGTDDTEGSVRFTDKRRIRWKRRVFCDNNKTITVRVRFVKILTETPDGGFTIRKRLIITFHISRNSRCNRITWDPTTDVEPEDDDIAISAGTGSSTDTTVTSTTTTGGSTVTSTSTGGSTVTSTSTSTSATATRTDSSSSKLMSALFLAVIAYLVF